MKKILTIGLMLVASVSFAQDSRKDSSIEISVNGRDIQKWLPARSGSYSKNDKVIKRDTIYKRYQQVIPETIRYGYYQIEILIRKSGKRDTVFLGNVAYF